MKKVILLLIILLLIVTLSAAIVTIHSIGFKSATGNPVSLKEGVTINFEIYHSITGGDMMNLDGVHADSDEDKVWVDKFIALTPSVNGYDSSVKVSTSNWITQGLNENKYSWFNIVCPDMTDIKSIQIRLGLHMTTLLMEKFYSTSMSSYVEIDSDPVTLNNPASGYYRFLYDVWDEPIVGNNLVLVPGIGLKLNTGTGLQIKTPVWNKRFITFDGTNYADMTTFVPSAVLGGSAFSISIWKKTSDEGTIIGSKDGSSNYFEIKMIP